MQNQSFDHFSEEISSQVQSSSAHQLFDLQTSRNGSPSTAFYEPNVFDFEQPENDSRLLMQDNIFNTQEFEPKLTKGQNQNHSFLQKKIQSSQKQKQEADLKSQEQFQIPLQQKTKIIAKIPKDRPKKKKRTYRKRNSKTNKIYTSGTKNILISFMRIISHYIRNYFNFNDESQRHSQIKLKLDEYCNQTKTNREQFVQLFSIPQFKEILQNMFQQKYIQRQIQMKRTKLQLRIYYLKRVTIFQKAFKEKRFIKIK